MKAVLGSFRFDWDPEKAKENLNKHKVSFYDAMSVLVDPLAISKPDLAHDGTDERWITIGMSSARGLLLVVHTSIEIADNATFVRIISARRPTRHEKRQYEQETP